MSMTLRIFLIICSVLSFLFCIKRIKQSKMKVTNAAIWMIGSIALILMAIFDNGVAWVATKLGFEAPVNFVFLVIIGFLLIEVFIENIRITTLNEKIKELDHYIALKELDDKEKKGENK